jgi:hypothetical protein
VALLAPIQQRDERPRIQEQLIGHDGWTR